jgi:hypothetical protein
VVNIASHLLFDRRERTSDTRKIKGANDAVQARPHIFTEVAVIVAGDSEALFFKQINHALVGVTRARAKIERAHSHCVSFVSRAEINLASNAHFNLTKDAPKIGYIHGLACEVKPWTGRWRVFGEGKRKCNSGG